MMRSDTRGVARVTAPKRSRSERGPPVCIISIAQQASPNSMYQTDDFRVQLRTSSILVVTTISGTLLISDMVSTLFLYPGTKSGRARDPLQPLEVMLRPHVDQANEEDSHEYQQLGERDEPPSLLHVVAEHDRDRVDERHLHVEDHEDQRDQVEADIEIDPRAARRGLAALVGGELAHLGVRRSQQPAETQHQGGRTCP